MWFYTREFISTTWETQPLGKWAEIQLTRVHPILVVLVLRGRESRPWVGSRLWKVRAGSHMASKVRARSKTKASKGRRKTNKQQAKIPPGGQIIEWDVLRQGRRAQAVALLEINRGYLDMCFWFQGVVDLKWMVGEEGGCSGPLAIHHGPVFDSPNACSWAASSIIHGYRRPGQSRAFYFSQVNNSCPLTQPRESRNRGTDKQGSRWPVEPFRTLTPFWFGSQRGSPHAHGPAASHREPVRDGLRVLEGSVPELPGQLTSFWGINRGLCWGWSSASQVFYW